MSYDTFISYHRESGAAEARLLQSSLQARGIQSFVDVSPLTAASAAALLEQITQTPNFIVVLPPNALDRCHEPQDWLRREIGQAIATGSNIIPVWLPGFSFPQDMPEDIRDLPRYHGVEYNPRNFDAMLAEIVAAIGPAQPLKLQIQAAAVPGPVVAAAPAPQANQSPSFNWALAGLTFLAFFIPNFLTLALQPSALLFRVLADGFFLSLEVALAVSLLSQWVDNPFAISAFCGLAHLVATSLLGVLFFSSFRLYAGGVLSLLWGALVPGSVALSRVPQVPRWALVVAPVVGAFATLLVGLVLSAPGFQSLSADVTRFVTPLFLGVAFLIGTKKDEKPI